MNLKNYIRDIENYPKPWIIFKDITPILYNSNAFIYCVEQLSFYWSYVDLVVWIESRWFIFWSAVAFNIKKPFIPVRKAWKLPWKVISEEYELEYWKWVLEMHTDSIKYWEKILLIDDLLATWWTANASIKLINKLWWSVYATSFIVELEFLNWRKNLKSPLIQSLIKY